MLRDLRDDGLLPDVPLGPWLEGVQEVEELERLELRDSVLGWGLAPTVDSVGAFRRRSHGGAVISGQA